MIYVVCSVSIGGIIQFACYFYNAIVQNGEKCTLLVPSETLDSNLFGIKANRIEIGNTFLEKKRNSLALANFINSLDSLDMVFFADDSVFSSNAMLHINKRVVTIIHDPHNHSYNFSFRAWIRNAYLNRKRKKVLKHSYKIVCLSENSRTQLLSSYGQSFRKKTHIFLLGPHYPRCNGKTPEELENWDNSYLLFYGRIEKYKNLDLLIDLFSHNDCAGLSLIVAGKGKISNRNMKLINSSNNIILINKYIPDDVTVYLFSSPKCRGVAMPYSDATQSGVLAMAYHYGKPVIVSNTPGLAEFVLNGKTGFVCNNDKEYLKSFECVSVEDYSTNCYQYCHEKLSYEDNMRSLLNDIY